MGAALVAAAACSPPPTPPAAAVPETTVEPAATASSAQPVPQPARPTVPNPEAPARSYVTQYANSSRNSRVRFPRPQVASLAALADLESMRPNDPKFIMAAFVLTAPQGRHILVANGMTSRVIDPDGKPSATVHGAARRNALLEPRGVFAAMDLVPWGKTVEHGTRIEHRWDRGELLAADWSIWSGADVFVTVWQSKGDSLRAVDDRFHSRRMIVSVFRMGLDGARMRAAFGTVWEDDHLEGEGCGAIGPDGRAVVAMVDGRFVVHAADLSPRQVPGGPIAVTTKIPYFAYDISVIEPGYALLSSARPEEIRPSAHAREVRDRLVRLRYAKGSWPTRLHRHDASGRELWSLDVSLSVRQPPIDGGGGRIYLAGTNGVIAVDDGKVAWQHLGSSLMMATAFEDGSLVVSNGNKLELLGRDGKVIQSFATAKGEALTTPPAPASDGSIWVASSEALYVAR